MPGKQVVLPNIIFKTDSGSSSEKITGAVTNWTYLIVSKYGENRLADVTWSNATFTGDGSSTSSNWDYYWTATVDDADSSKAYYASVTTNYNGSYAGNVVSTKSKGDSLKAIGVSHIE